MAMAMTIKGCLWHEGSDGLGVGPMWLRRWLPYRERFDAAARVHDECYDIKGDGRDRFLYDKHLLEMMMRVSENDVEGLFSIVYYVMVRAFGWAFYRYGRG